MNQNPSLAAEEISQLWKLKQMDGLNQLVSDSESTEKLHKGLV